MVAKPYRRRRILELLEDHRPASQYELLDLLEAEGIGATQATLSRDLHALGVAKGPGGYVLPEAPPVLDDGERSLEATLQRELLAADHGAATVVLRTQPAHANALAVEIDRARLDEVVGTVAGDDTVLVIARSTAQARTLVKRFRAIAGHP